MIGLRRNLRINNPANPRIRVADRPADYVEAGLALAPERWEDGQRTGMGRGDYEWWYFDVHLDNGAVLVIIVFSKPMNGIGQPAAPYLNVRLFRPGQADRKFELPVDCASFRVSKRGCDIIAGASRIEQDGSQFHLSLALPNFRARLTFTATVPAWRPGTGRYEVDGVSGQYFAWLAQMPSGVVEGTMEVEGIEAPVRGSGYHDHNWGTVEIAKLWSSWWWSRAQVGEHTVIAAELTASATFGAHSVPIFLVTRGEERICEDWNQTSLRCDHYVSHPVTGAAMAQLLCFQYQDEHRNLSFQLSHQEDLFVHSFLAKRSWPTRAVARLMGMDPRYYRMRGRAQLEINETGSPITYTGESVYERMSFRNHLPAANKHRPHRGQP